MDMVAQLKRNAHIDNLACSVRDAVQLAERMHVLMDESQVFLSKRYKMSCQYFRKRLPTCFCGSSAVVSESHMHTSRHRICCRVREDMTTCAA